MKKRIGTLKGKPIVEGGGNNIIKENEININDIGSNSGGDSDDDGMLYFGSYIVIDMITSCSSRKLVDYRENDDGTLQEVSINGIIGVPDTNFYFVEFGMNPNLKTIYEGNKWLSPKELFEKYSFKLEYFKPISKEEFYRTEYTVEEAEKIKQEYKDYTSQFFPSETE